MAYDFPGPPLTIGQVYPTSPLPGQAQYTWDGEKWTMGVSSGVTPDTTPPTVATLSPANNATGISLSSLLTITFSEAVAFGTGNITLKRTSDDSTIEAFNVATEVGTGTGQISISGAAATMHLTANMLGATGYYITVDATAIKDLANNFFAGISSKTTWNWVTVATDTSAPTLVSLSPADNATNVPIATNFTATYSEAIVAGTTASFRLYTAANALIETLNQTHFGTKITIAGSAVTLDWTANLTPGTSYYILSDAGSVKDTAGNLAAGITATTTWSFSTAVVDTTPPTVVSLSPADGATLVPVATTTLVMTFNEPIIEPASLGTNVVLHKADGTTVQSWFHAQYGTLWSISGSTATFTLAAPLLSNTSYYMIVGAFSVTDPSDNGFVGILTNTGWNFTTETVMLDAPSLALFPADDTGTVGDNITTVANPRLVASFGSVVIATNGKLYFRVNGVVANTDGVGYHLITSGEAGGADITVSGVPGLVATNTYPIEAKYEAPGGGPSSDWGPIYSVTINPSSSYTAEATALFAAMTPAPDTTRKNIINNAILGLKTGPVHGTNNWANLRWYSKIGTYSQWSLLNWKNPAESAILDEPGHNPTYFPAFTADRHFKGDGAHSAVMDTLIVHNAASPFVMNSGAMSCYCMIAPAVSQPYFGVGSNAVGIAFFGSSYPYAVSAINGFFDYTLVDMSPATRLITVSTTGSTGQKVYRDGAVIFTSPGGGGPAAAPGSTYTFTALYLTGTGGSDAAISMLCYGGERTDNMEADLKSVIETYMVAIGATLP